MDETRATVHRKTEPPARSRSSLKTSKSNPPDTASRVARWSQIRAGGRWLEAKQAMAVVVTFGRNVDAVMSGD